MPEYDSPHWDWGKGYCRKHPGQGLPCRACIDGGCPDVAGGWHYPCVLTEDRPANHEPYARVEVNGRMSSEAFSLPPLSIREMLNRLGLKWDVVVGSGVPYLRVALPGDKVAMASLEGFTAARPVLAQQQEPSPRVDPAERRPDDPEPARPAHDRGMLRMAFGDLAADAILSYKCPYCGVRSGRLEDFMAGFCLACKPLRDELAAQWSRVEGMATRREAYDLGREHGVRIREQHARRRLGEIR